MQLIQSLIADQAPAGPALPAYCESAAVTARSTFQVTIGQFPDCCHLFHWTRLLSAADLSCQRINSLNASLSLMLSTLFQKLKKCCCRALCCRLGGQQDTGLCRRAPPAHRCTRSTHCSCSSELSEPRPRKSGPPNIRDNYTAGYASSWHSWCSYTTLQTSWSVPM